MCFYWIISLYSSTISASVLEYITLIRILLFIYCCYLKEVALSFPFGENGGGAHEFLFFLIHFLLPAILVLQLNNLRRRHSRLTAGHKHLAVSNCSFMLSLLSIHTCIKRQSFRQLLQQKFMNWYHFNCISVFLNHSFFFKRYDYQAIIYLRFFSKSQKAFHLSFFCLSQ